MRTTLTLDDTLGIRLKRIAGEKGLTFKEAVNRTLALGMENLRAPPGPKPYRTRARPLGLRPGLSYDRVEELLSLVEGEARK